MAVDFVDFCGKYRVPLMKFLCRSHEHDVGDTGGLAAATLRRSPSYNDDDALYAPSSSLPSVVAATASAASAATVAPSSASAAPAAGPRGPDLSRVLLTGYQEPAPDSDLL